MAICKRFDLFIRLFLFCYFLFVFFNSFYIIFLFRYLASFVWHRAICIEYPMMAEFTTDYEITFANFFLSVAVFNF